MTSTSLYSRSVRSLWWFATFIVLLCFTVPESQAQIRFDFSLTPTVNWLGDIESSLEQIGQGPGAADPDSLRALYEQDYPARIGFEAGLGLTFNLGPAGLRTGLRVLNPGGVFSGSGEWDQEQLLENFVIASVDLQYRRPLGTSTTFYLFGGPEFRYYLDLRDESDITLSVIQENMEPVSTSASAGAGITLRFGGFSISPELRYAHGLSGVNRRVFEADGYRFSDDYRLNTFSFGLRFGQ